MLLILEFTLDGVVVKLLFLTLSVAIAVNSAFKIFELLIISFGKINSAWLFPSPKAVTDCAKSSTGLPLTYRVIVLIPDVAP